MIISILPTHHNPMTLTLYDIENKSESKTSLLRFVSLYRMNFISAVLKNCETHFMIFFGK